MRKEQYIKLNKTIRQALFDSRENNLFISVKLVKGCKMKDENDINIEWEYLIDRKMIDDFTFEEFEKLINNKRLISYCYYIIKDGLLPEYKHRVLDLIYLEDYESGGLID